MNEFMNISKNTSLNIETLRNADTGFATSYLTLIVGVNSEIDDVEINLSLHTAKEIINFLSSYINKTGN